MPITPERWLRIEQLYHNALERTSEERAGYLEAQCAGDQALRAEVESLLLNGQENGFLERQAINVAAESYLPEEMPDLTGRTLGRYEVISRLGAGGMGVVYRARDIRLKRDVAIKVLSAGSLADTDRKRRFVQEAHTASSLNHAHIVGMYDIDQVDGIDFIAMEYLPGKSLAEILRGQPLPVADVIRYGIQIADALAAAHAAGIVHRDIKPGNIMVSSQGQVKVLDFGLAKLAEPREPGTPTVTGWIRGTPAYMSPEQAQGEKVDARSDIFSFGAVLYEMLTGRPAFRRQSNSESVAAILRDDPEPVNHVTPAVPHDLNRLVSHCLRKDRNRRYHSMADVKIALEDVGQNSAAPEDTGPNRTGRTMVAAIAAGVLSAGLGVILFLRSREASHSPPQVTQLTFDSRLALNPAVSADGKYVAYASDRSGEGNLDIWVQSLPAGEPVRLTKDEANEDLPDLSPDSTKVAFRSERDSGGIYVVPVVGGEPRLLARGATRPKYSPDGSLLLFSTGDELFDARLRYQRSFVVGAQGGEPRELPISTPLSHFIVWSPDATRLLDGSQIPSDKWYIRPISGEPPVVLSPPAGLSSFESNPFPFAWLRSNHVLYSASSGDAVNLWRAKLSQRTWRFTERAERLTFGPGQIAGASASNNGTIVFAGTSAQTRLWSIPYIEGVARTRGDILAFPQTGGIDDFPSLSETGKMAYLSQRSGKWSLWLRNLASGRETLLAAPTGDISVVINRRGSHVAYTTSSKGEYAIFTLPTSGGSAERVCERCGQVRAWSSDDAVMATQEMLMAGGKIVSAHLDWIETASGRKSVMAEQKGVFLFAPDFSPDDRWVAFQARPLALEARVEQLFIAPVHAGLRVDPSRWIAVTDLKYFDFGPKWSRDGKMLYFMSFRDGSTCLWAVRLDPATKKPVGEPFAVRHFHTSPRHYSRYPVFSLGPDRIVISLEQVQSDLWMMQLPDEN
jgi:eukaryotic-like serine/threonine-protein kinase